MHHAVRRTSTKQALESAQRRTHWASGPMLGAESKTFLYQGFYSKGSHDVTSAAASRRRGSSFSSSTFWIARLTDRRTIMLHLEIWQPGCPFLYLFDKVYVSLFVRGPYLDTIFQQWSYHDEVQVPEHFPVHTIKANFDQAKHPVCSTYYTPYVLTKVQLVIK